MLCMAGQGKCHYINSWSPVHPSLLLQNIAAMEQSERTRTIGVLSSVQTSIESVASPAEDMISYMHRLLKRLLDNISLSWQLPHLSPPSQLPHRHLPPPSTNVSHPPPNLDALNLDTLNVAAPWDTSTAQEIIRDELWFSQLSLPLQPNVSPPQAGPASAAIQPQASVAAPMESSTTQQQQLMLFPPNDDDFWSVVMFNFRRWARKRAPRLTLSDHRKLVFPAVV